VRGDTIVVRVTVDNSGGSQAYTGCTISVDFGGAAGFTANTTYPGLTVAIGAIVIRDFLVTIGTAASCNIRGHFVATSQ